MVQNTENLLFKDDLIVEREHVYDIKGRMVFSTLKVRRLKCLIVKILRTAQNSLQKLVLQKKFSLQMYKGP